MTSKARELFSRHIPFDEVIMRMGGLDELIRSIESDEDYSFLSAEERHMIDSIKSAIARSDHPTEEEDGPDQDAYYDE